MELLVLILFAGVGYLVWRGKKTRRELAQEKKAHSDLEIRFNVLREAKEQLDATNAASIRALTERAIAAETDRDSLAQFKHVRDVSLEAERMAAEATDGVSKARADAAGILESAKAEASRLAAAANSDAKSKRAASEQMLARASTQAAKVIEDAQQRAKEIAGDALRAVEEADKLEAISVAMRNVIEGYGDSYMIPAHSLLDELADAYTAQHALRFRETQTIERQIQTDPIQRDKWFRQQLVYEARLLAEDDITELHESTAAPEPEIHVA